jgi:hypothetical protein
MEAAKIPVTATQEQVRHARRAGVPGRRRGGCATYRSTLNPAREPVSCCTCSACAWACLWPRRALVMPCGSPVPCPCRAVILLCDLPVACPLPCRSKRRRARQMRTSSSASCRRATRRPCQTSALRRGLARGEGRFRWGGWSGTIVDGKDGYGRPGPGLRPCVVLPCCGHSVHRQGKARVLGRCPSTYPRVPLPSCRAAPPGPWHAGC